MSGFDAGPLAGILVVALVALAAFVYMRRAKTSVSDSVVKAIEQHFASVGTVMFISPVLMPFGKAPPGAQQYNVDLTTPFGFSQSHTVEVDQSGNVRTLL